MASANLRDKYRQTMTVVTGEFEGRVIEAVAGKSSASNDMITMTFQIEGGPHHGRTIKDRAVLSDNTVRMFFEKMAPLGLKDDFFDVPDGQEPPSLEATARELVGRPCRFKVKKGNYRGIDQEEIDRILPPTPGAVRTAPTASANGTPNGVPGVPAPAPTGGIPGVPPVATPPAVAPPEVKLPDGTDPPF